MSLVPSPPSLAFWNPPSWALMGLALAGILWLGLAPPMVAALVMFCLILAIRRVLSRKFPSSPPIIATGLCALLACSILYLAGLGVFGLLDNDSGIPAMALALTSAMETLRQKLPSLAGVIPPSSEALFNLGVAWLQEHAGVLTSFGAKVTKLGFHLVIGLLVGTLAAHAFMVRPPSPPPGGLVSRMLDHLSRFRGCFERVVFAQVYIAGTNAIFTGIFLAWIMPSLGYPMPFVKTLPALTFILGLVPILGNIASNTLICGVALTVSPMAAAVALAFLVTIHKLEYFLNAWIVGAKIKVQSYEILGAMLVMEALFGLWGLALAPVLYSYLKEELRVAEKRLYPDPEPAGFSSP